MCSLFWREVVRPEAGLFEAVADGGMVLPRVDAPLESLRALGLVMVKCALDQHPVRSHPNQPHGMEWHGTACRGMSRHAIPDAMRCHATSSDHIPPHPVSLPCNWHAITMPWHDALPHLRCILDDHPIGAGLCSIVFDFLVHAHSATAFNSPEQALLKLAEFDPQLAAAWRAILLDPSQREGLSLYDFDDQLGEQPLTDDNTPRAILAGCRRRLLADRLEGFTALRSGFLLHEDLQVQLASMSELEVVQMLQGKETLTGADLVDCVEWPWSSEEAAREAGFGESSVPEWLEALLLDESEFDEPRRLQLLQWTTALRALPLAGLRNQRIKLRLYRDVDDGTLPETHTCTHELHIPAYPSRTTLRDKLILALAHRDDGFQIT